MPKDSLPYVDPESLKTYRAAFAPDHSPAFGRQDAYGKPWRTIWKGGLYDGCIVRHMVGPTCYAASKFDAPHQLRLLASTVAIDLDKDKQDDALPMLVRYDKVLKAFAPALPIVFTTPSGGLHVYFLTYKPEPRNRLLEWARDSLRGQGLEEDFGHVEILEGQGNLRRLPLNAGCYLLDPITHNKQAQTTLDCFYELVDLLHRHPERIAIPRDWEPTYSETLKKATGGRPPGATAQSGQKRPPERPERSVSVDGLLDSKNASDWLTGGLTGNSQRYRLNCELVRHFGLHGYRGDALVEQVVRWYDSKHNNQSNSWLKERRRCIGNIQRLVATYKAPSVEFSIDRQAWEDRRDQLPTKSSRKVFDLVCRLADSNGIISEDGSRRLVSIHHKALRRSAGAKYTAMMRGLKKMGLVKIAKEYSTFSGNPQTRIYELPEELFSTVFK
jgi:hypothetical protein